MSRRILALCLGMLSLAACETGGDQPFDINADGLIFGQAIVDVDGNGNQDPGDRPLPGLRIRFGFRGVPDTIRSVVTDAEGRFEVTLPVGEYTARIDPSSVPDSLVVLGVDDPVSVVRSGEETLVTVTTGYPPYTVAQARALPAGRRIFVEAVVANPPGTYQSGAVHVIAESGEPALRVFGLPNGSVQLGDRVRLLGTTGRREGQPTLETSSAFVLAEGEAPAPIALNTGRAATADQGTRDAALVRIDGATILSSVQTGNEFRFNLDDGSGIVEGAVRLNAGFDLLLLQPGTEVDVVGTLEAVGGNRWRIMPRTREDISLGFPTVTVAQARALPAGQTVVIVGTALNARNAFTDTTVHVLDPTGSIRATNVRPGTVLAGDLVRFIGTTARRDGQPVLDDVQPFVLNVGTLPTPILLSSATAATASSGTLDAAQVQVRQVSVVSVDTVANELSVIVNDGSGPLEVRIRRDTGIMEIEDVVPNANLNVSGVLAPDPSSPGRWRLRVRTGADIVSLDDNG